jgi:hypothetical protein
MSTRAKTNYRNVKIENGLVFGEHDAYGSGWTSFSGSLKGMLVREVWLNGPGTAVAAIWQEQDGYGVPGYTPSQGLDWSGVRDSTHEAWDVMYEIAKKYLSVEDFLIQLGVL